MKSKTRIVKSDNSFAIVNNPFVWIFPFLIIPQLIMNSTDGYPFTENPLFWMVIVGLIVSIIVSISVRRQISHKDPDIIKVLERELEYLGEIKIYSSGGIFNDIPRKKRSVEKAMKYIQDEEQMGYICEIETF